MRLEYRWMPNWRLDPYEGWYTTGFSTHLCYSLDDGLTWTPIPTQEWSDKKEDQLEIVLEHTDFDMLKDYEMMKQTHHGWSGREILKIQKERKNER